MFNSVDDVSCGSQSNDDNTQHIIIKKKLDTIATKCKNSDDF